jgi:hypothetical protein
MAKKRLTAKEASAQRTKAVRALFNKAILAQQKVITGSISSQMRWMDDIERVNECVLRAMKGDLEVEEEVDILIRRYDFLERNSAKR